jgi:hypothetical protein
MILAAIPYAVLQVDRGLRRVLGGFGGVPLLIVILLAVAVVPPLIEASERQPIGQNVDDLRDGVSSLTSWVRMDGEIVTLSPPDSVASGQLVQSLLVEPTGDAVVILSPDPVDHLTEITGRVQPSANMGDTARRVGGERFPVGELEVIDRFNIAVDDPIVPSDRRNWTLVWVLLAAAATLFVGSRVGYPIVRLRRDAPVPAAIPLEIHEEMGVRLIEPQLETGPAVTGPWGRLRRVPRQRDTDPYFELLVEGQRPIEFRRHRWSLATPATVTSLRERMPAVHLHDWGIEVILGLTSEADRDRLLASFAIGEDEDEAQDQPATSEQRLA